jgi:hypothetical protein
MSFFIIKTISSLALIINIIIQRHINYHNIMNLLIFVGFVKFMNFTAFFIIIYQI